MQINNPQSFRILAAAMFAAFEADTRGDGSTFYKLRDGSPEWMSDTIRAAHDAVDEMPDDAVYEACRDAASRLEDGAFDDIGDAAHEFADGEVNPYNAARVAWLAEKPLIRGPLCDEACEELSGSESGIFERIGFGWYEWARRIFYAVAEGINEEADANPCAWVAGWNLPGCLPEMEPAGFETWEEARDFIVEELGRYDDEPGADDARRIAEWLEESAGENEDMGQQVGGLVYWIRHAGGEG